MSLSNCIKCWDAPCACGYEYRNWTKEKRIEQASKILGISSKELIKFIVIPEYHPMYKDN